MESIMNKKADSMKKVRDISLGGVEMKFLHLGDLHIGKYLNEFDLIEDQEYILKEIMKIAEDNSVDAIFIAGDVYDKAMPREKAVQLFDVFLADLAKRKIKTFIISGNHDSEERLQFGSRLFEAHDIYIAAKYEGDLPKQIVRDEFGEIHIYMLPFVKASQVRHFFPNEEITTYDEAVRVILKHAEIDESKRNILIAHQFVGSEHADPAFAGSEGIAARSVGTVEKIGYDCFAQFDYVALGHIHSAQHVGRENVRYAGSPLKYSLSEVNHHKTMPMVTFNKKGETEVELVELKPMRDMRHLKGTLKQLLDEKYIQDENDFIYVTLTEEDVIDGAMTIFQQHYPNTVKIDYDNAHTRAIDQVNITQITKDKSFDELIQDFYQYVYGCEISEEEMALIHEVGREAGVTDEAN